MCLHKTKFHSLKSLICPFFYKTNYYISMINDKTFIYGAIFHNFHDLCMMKRVGLKASLLNLYKPATGYDKILETK